MTFGFLESTLDTRSADGRNDVLLSELHFRDDDGTLYKVPVFAETNGGDIPWFAQIIPGFQPIGDHWKSWVLHDSAYRGTLMVSRGGQYFSANLTRYESDSLLTRALKKQGMGTIRRNTVFASVQAGGWRHYRKP